MDLVDLGIELATVTGETGAEDVSVCTLVALGGDTVADPTTVDEDGAAIDCLTVGMESAFAFTDGGSVTQHGDSVTNPLNAAPFALLGREPGFSSQCGGA
jgi:hypothetical protein